MAALGFSCVLLPWFALQMSLTVNHARYLACDLINGSDSTLIDNQPTALAIGQIDLKPTDAAGAPLLVQLRRLVRKKAGRRLSPLAACKAVLQGNHPNREIRGFFEEVPADDKHLLNLYLLCATHAATEAAQLAAHFTPPHLAKYAIEKLVSLGITPCISKILNPSSGAAFLVPMAQAIAVEGRRRELGPRKTLTKIQETIAGIKIDKSLGKLSQLLLADLLAPELSKTRRKMRIPITNGDSLETVEPAPRYEAVIGDPR
jgi:hypothetical protein